MSTSWYIYINAAFSHPRTDWVTEWVSESAEPRPTQSFLPLHYIRPWDNKSRGRNCGFMMEESWLPPFVSHQTRALKSEWVQPPRLGRCSIPQQPPLCLIAAFPTTTVAAQWMPPEKRAYTPNTPTTKKCGSQLRSDKVIISPRAFLSSSLIWRSRRKKRRVSLLTTDVAFFLSSFGGG